MKTVIAIKSAILIIGFIFYMFNRANPRIEGQIINKIYLPSQITERDSYSILFDAAIKERIRLPEKYLLVLKANDRTRQCEVSEEVYEALKIGDCYSTN